MSQRNANLSANKVRDGKTITDIELLTDLMKTHHDIDLKSNMNIDAYIYLFESDNHDYNLSILDVANHLEISRQTCSDWIIPQLDRVQANSVMRKKYKRIHGIPDDIECRLQYLISKKSLNEYIVSAFNIQKTRFSIVLSLDDMDKFKINFLKDNLGHKRSWQGKINTACEKACLEHKAPDWTENLLDVPDENVALDYSKLELSLEDAQLHSMASILKDNWDFANIKYSMQMYRMLIKTNYIEGRLPCTINNQGGNDKGIRYIFDSNLKQNIDADATKFLYFSISEEVFNWIKYLAYVETKESYQYNSNENSTEVKEAFENNLFYKIAKYIV